MKIPSDAFNGQDIFECLRNTDNDYVLAPLTTDNLRVVNKAMRAVDDSETWPVNGRFNATDRAIRRVRKLMRDAPIETVYEYVMAVDQELSAMVNAPATW